MKSRSTQGRRLPSKGGKSKTTDSGDSLPQTLAIYEKLTNSSLNYMPSRYRTRLRFYAFKSINNSGLTFANTRFFATGCNDVDPALGSPAMPGFTELGALYLKYRLRSSSIKVGFNNLDVGSSANCVVCPTNQDFGNNSSLFYNIFASRRAKTALLGEADSLSTREIRHSFNMDEYTGIRYTAQDDIYSSLTNTIPSNNVYWYVGIQTSSAMTSGVSAVVTIDCDLEFYELATPSN
jgi:hypothetical protein